MSRAPGCFVGVALTLAPLLLSAQAQNPPPTVIIQNGVQSIGGSFDGGVVVFGGAQPPPGQPPRDTQPQTGHSIVRGRIVGADNGQPIRRATVRINGSAIRGLRSTLTDSSGHYEFSELPAGSFTVTATKPAFADSTYGQTQPSGPGKPITLTDRQTVEGIDIRLPRGGVITGHVFDEFGEPVTNAMVMPMRSQFIQGQRRMMPSGPSSQTNDIGEFRIFGLRAGQYIVSATLREPSFGPPGNFPTRAAEDRSGYAATYYPGTPDMNSTARITVNVGQSLSEINFALSPTRVAEVSGIAVDAEGRPLPSGAVMVAPRGGVMGPNMLNGMIRGDGLFTVSNVPPGDYVLRAMTPRLPGSPGAPVGPPEFSVGFVTVNGQDVTGVRLAPLVPVTISGRVSFDDPSAAPSIKPSGIRIISAPMNQDFGPGFAMPGNGPVQVHDDFTFELKTVPGQYSLRATVAATLTTSGQAGAGGTSGAGGGGGNLWAVKSVRLGGRDVTDSGITVSAEEVNGLEIELTNRTTQITGQVTDARGIVKDYVTLLFSQDRKRWTQAGDRYFRVGRPGQDGRFKVTTLPPGDYYGIALDRADPGEFQDPEFLESLSRQASTFSLTEGETRTVDLRLFTLQ